MKPKLTPKTKICLIFSGLVKAHLHIYALADMYLLEDKSGGTLFYPISELLYGEETVVTAPKHLSMAHKKTRISYSLIAHQLKIKPSSLNHYINGRAAPSVKIFSHLLDIMGLTFGDICALWSKTEEELELWWDWFRHEDLWRFQAQGQRPANDYEAIALTFVSKNFKRLQTGLRKNYTQTMMGLVSACYTMDEPYSWANVTRFFSTYSPRTTPDASHAITGRPWDTATHEQAAKDFEYRLAKLGKRL